MRILITPKKFLPSRRIRWADLVISIFGKEMTIYPMNEEAETHIMNSPGSKIWQWKKGVYNFKLSLFIFFLKPIKNKGLVRFLKKNIPGVKICF